MTTIHLLPISDPKTSTKNLGKAFAESQRIAPTLDYIPDSLETLQAIDYIDFKLMMKLNHSFYEAAVKLCADIISTMIEDAKSLSRKKSVKNAKCLDDLLNSGYYSDDYEESKGEFINVLAEDYLCGC